MPSFLIETEGLSENAGLVPRLHSTLAENWPQPFGCVQVLGFRMNGNIYDHVDEYRAAVLLGMPPSELRRYSRASGLGHVENDEKGQKVVFTYEELRRICLLVAQSSK